MTDIAAYKNAKPLPIIPPAVLTGAQVTNGPRVRIVALEGGCATLLFTILLAALWNWALNTRRMRYQRVQHARALAEAEAKHTTPDPNAGRANLFARIAMAAMWLALIAREVVWIVTIWRR